MQHDLRFSARRCQRPLRHLLLILLLLGIPAEGLAQQTDVRVHDPVLIRQGDTYYLFATGSGIAVWSSTDLESWTREPPVFSAPPEWTQEVVPGFRGHIWAPDIYEHEGRYYLYYSVSAFGKNTSAIGVASNSTLDRSDPEFEWRDHGLVVRSVPGRDMWNAIDPNVLHDQEGRPWMTFGSFWEGLKLVRLDEDLTRLAEPEEWYTVAARRRDWKLDARSAGNAENGAIEAPFIFRKNGYYYLFVSWDACCRGAESTYRVMVGRSEEVTGPYVDRQGKKLVHGGGSPVVSGFDDSDRWAAGGHNAVYTVDGTDYLVFHAYDLGDEGKSKLMIRPIHWDEDGWPTARVQP